MLRLPRSQQQATIHGVAGIAHGSSVQSISTFKVLPTNSTHGEISVTAVVVPRVTANLPLKSIQLNPEWKHLSGIQLADPDFGFPSKVDLLLGVDVFVNVLLNGQRIGPPGTPTALETVFGWVLAGGVGSGRFAANNIMISNHVSIFTGDDLLRKFWEIEEGPKNDPMMFSPQEKLVVNQFLSTHKRSNDGRFIVQLPKKLDAKALGESRAQAVRRFYSLERSLRCKGRFKIVDEVIQEYFKLGHAEMVPMADLDKPTSQVFYLPIHAVEKESSATTKVRAVFDASAKSASNVSLNDTLLVGPTVHPPLIDVLLRFRLHRIALTTDISKMYRAVRLTESDKDLHRFVWRQSPNDTLNDYRMTRAAFGVSSSAFVANMAVRQNALDHAEEFPMASRAVLESFYVDDCLSGADSVKEATELQRQLYGLFRKGGFLLHKWNSNVQTVLRYVPDEHKDPLSSQVIPDAEGYTRTLGIEWNAKSDRFRLTVSDVPDLRKVTKRFLVSDIAKVYDVLGWFSPCVIKVKILLQKVWERKIGWDEEVPPEVLEVWLKWRNELTCLSSRLIPRCYFPTDFNIACTELHGFCDASELAYAAVVYLRFTNPSGLTQISLVTSKTKVAPLKRLSIPRLELCGAVLLAQLLDQLRRVFKVPLSLTHAWTDSTIVLQWLDGSPKRFKTYVGIRISTTIDLIPPSRWHHVNGCENSADCGSRGLFPSELVNHTLWWHGPTWLGRSPDNWPQQRAWYPNEKAKEEEKVVLNAFQTCGDVTEHSLVSPDRYSSFTRLKRVTAWVLRFTRNCRSIKSQGKTLSPLSTTELKEAECYWMRIIQNCHFYSEISTLKKLSPLQSSSCLKTVRPFIDSKGLLRVGGRQQMLRGIGYEAQHPLILHGKHPLTRLIVLTEHFRILHAGPTLLSASLATRYHIVKGRAMMRSVYRQCVVCRRHSVKPTAQMMGQLPIERITPGPIFDKTGVDFAGPILTKFGHVRKPTIVKSYICVFVSLTVKAVHLEVVSDLTTEAFIACL